jgi:uncharacterized protein YprB with RNaseH-like and TPR domain
MRDLVSRLRAIVRQPVPSRAPTADAPIRELTYVPEGRSAGPDFEVTAERLGGVRHQAGDSACVVVDRVWEPEDWHGRRQVRSYALDPRGSLALFDGRLASVADWAARPVFFDIETTGLSGGAGTLPLLAACGWFEHDGFRVRQFFLNGPAGEHALLDGLARIFDEASLLVTYNGRTFDVPVMETRWAFHRQGSPAGDLPHLDMLPIARKLWGRGAESGCTLTALERTVLRFHRFDDVPGLEIPSRYFQFLRTGDPSIIAGVLDHNRHDVVSLAALMGHALQLAADGPEACEQACERLGLARMYERAGDLTRAELAYALASVCEDPDLAADALARLAVLLRRQGRFEEAAAAWQGVLTLSDGGDIAASLARQAAEALAIHHEHRAGDYSAARRYAETLSNGTTGRRATDVERRLGRLDRKIKRSAETRGRLLG